MKPYRPQSKYQFPKPRRLLFITGAGGTYYADSDGTAVYGWKKIDKEYYYFDRESGKMFSGRKADGIRLKADGTASGTTADIEKIQAGWEVTFANDIFDHHQGCCVSEASATAFLFHECGYPQVYVATDTGHAWVELNGRVYDPLFAESRDFNSYYNVPYEGYGMRAVVRHKI